jgi:serine/threonine-protein kinase
LSPLAAGTTLCDGRYRLDAVVGRGGMATVWRASDLQLERDVAIKVIADVLADDPRFVARFEREARLAAALNHPNLVKLFDYSVLDERPFLVMEYVGGGTLAEARAQALDVDALARDLLDAVAHIHAAGILHRDIKPANVLLDADGAPRLTDFGIARGEETTGLTQTGQVLGTLRYIAPEVAGGEPATVRSDLYALGVLLGELSGTRSEPLERLLPRMTARDPAERPASAQEALADLDPTRILEPTTPEATERAGVTPRSGRGISRGQAVAAAAVLVAVLALIVIAASGGGGDSPAATRHLGPAPAGAPADQQIDRLERIVRAAPRKP